MTVLALDLGTTTGFAIKPASGVIVSGTWSLKPGKHEGAGMRYFRFDEYLTKLHVANKFKRIGFELVRRHLGTQAAHIYGGLKGTLEKWSVTYGVPCEPIPVGSIKLFWTGNGAADKDRMIAKAVQLGFSPVDDNEADALAILHLMSSENYAELVKPKPKKKRVKR